MYNRDSPPPSWYEPPDEEEEDEEMSLALQCQDCGHVWQLNPGEKIDANSEVECPECGSEDQEIA